jgi:signal transduction histidine kinase
MASLQHELESIQHGLKSVQGELKSFPPLTWRGVLKAPFSLRNLLDTCYNLLAFPLGLMWFVAFLVLLTLGVGMIPLALVGLAILFFTFLLAQGAATVERELGNTLLSISVDPPVRRTPTSRNPLQHFWARLIDPVTWKELIYLFLRFPLGLVSFIAALVLWTAAVTGLATPFIGWLMITNGPEGEGAFMWLQGSDPSVFAYLANVATGAGALLLVPWVMRGFGLLYTAMSHVLLGRSREQELEHEVERLADSRERSVDATTTERVRIERDLHDGAQARLLSLAVDLGRARDRLSAEAPDSEATTLVTDAHEQAKVALTELRDLARGIHPAVLTDRGLDAALSSLAAGSPVPVSLEVDLPERPSPRIEAVAYFVLSELLANVARHSQAASTQVTVARRDDRLVLEVGDDGIGGADPAKGTGLAGLAERVQAVDGTLTVSSPEGGPTLVRTDLPFQ